MRQKEEEEEDWYLTSGGMCQRNSCRQGSNTGPLGETIDFVARQLVA
jgi:hypothetical protein